MPSPRAEFSRFSRRAARWLWPAALLALTPKCALCVLAYIGLGTALGPGSPEWCSPSANSPTCWVTWLAWLGVAGALGTLGSLASCRRVRSALTAQVSAIPLTMGFFWAYLGLKSKHGVRPEWR